MTKVSAKRVASRYMQSKLFGLLSNHIGWQNLKRFQDQLQWMIKGEYSVSSLVKRTGEKSILIKAQDSIIEVLGFKREGSGFSYRNLVIKIDGRIVEKTEDLDKVKRVVAKHLISLGINKT